MLSIIGKFLSNLFFFSDDQDPFPKDGDVWQSNGYQCWGGGGGRTRLLLEGDLLSACEGEEVCTTGGGAAGTG